jgi:two-component system sensor histidine kinase DegS
MALFLIPLVIILLVGIELEWRRKQKEISVEREQERKIYLGEIFRVQEEERLRLSRELHDDTLQELITVATRARMLASFVDHKDNPNKKAKQYAQWIKDKVLEMAQDLRRLCLDLRPSALDTIGLVPSLRLLAERLNQETKIEAKMMVRGVERKMRPEIDISLFRIVQEALNNIRYHAEATRATITLLFAEKQVKLIIKDNGKGFILNEPISTLAKTSKLGLIGIQQRIGLLGGIFFIDSKLGKGTTLSIEIKDAYDERAKTLSQV